MVLACLAGDGVPALVFARYGAPADIATAEALGPVDLVHSGIGAGLGLADRAAQPADAQHAAAIGKGGAVGAGPGAGMEYRKVSLRHRVINALDQIGKAACWERG